MFIPHLGLLLVQWGLQVRELTNLVQLWISVSLTQGIFAALPETSGSQNLALGIANTGLGSRVSPAL